MMTKLMSKEINKILEKLLNNKITMLAVNQALAVVVRETLPQQLIEENRKLRLKLDKMQAALGQLQFCICCETYFEEAMDSVRCAGCSEYYCGECYDTCNSDCGDICSFYCHNCIDFAKFQNCHQCDTKICIKHQTQCQCGAVFCQYDYEEHSPNCLALKSQIN